MALSAKELITQYKDEYGYCEQEYMKSWNSIIIDVDEEASESKKNRCTKRSTEEGNR